MMGLRRLLYTMHYGLFSRSRRALTIVLIVIIAGIVFIPHFLNSKSSKTLQSSHQSSSEVHVTDESPKLPETSLEISGKQFKLQGKPFTILSGSMHYFRVVPEYWSDRLSKLKAMGLNTVTTYIPWNIHEEVKGAMKFKERRYDIVSFIKEANKLGLYVILRPGPFVDGELDLGGLPSWLLEETKGNLRSSNSRFLGAVEKYFSKLLPLLVSHQFCYDGPIIAWQIENEYSSFGADSDYMKALQEIMLKNGVKELMITADSLTGLELRPLDLPGVLKTLNLQYLIEEKSYLEDVKKLQPDKPLMVTQFWLGWYDHWGEQHHTVPLDKVDAGVATALAMGASINFYMFHGGTNFDFMNGANSGEKFEYLPMITSFDYDALLTEAGDVTSKYKQLRKVIRAHAPQHSIPKTFPDIPANIMRRVYDPVKMDHHIPITNMYQYIDQALEIKEIVPMEKLLINSNGGQCYGFIVYRTKLPPGAKKLYIEKYRDRAQVMVGSQLVVTLDAMDFEKNFMNVEKMMFVDVDLKYKLSSKEGETVYLDILVENMGRSSSSSHMNNQYKGLMGEVLIDGNAPKSWTVYPLSFHETFISRAFVEGPWDSIPSTNHVSLFPGFFKGTFAITDKPQDTFLDMTGWGKGVAFVNDRILGRYWNIGPQQTLYIPATWLQPETNTIIIFELESRSPDGLLKFSKEPILDKLNKKKQNHEKENTQ